MLLLLVLIISAYTHEGCNSMNDHKEEYKLVDIIYAVAIL